MSRFIKVTTDCNFAGCSDTHLVEIPDDMTEEEIAEIVDEMVAEDIAPEGSYEEIDNEEVEEMVNDGYDVETYGFVMEDGDGVEEDDDNDVPGTGEDE